MAKLEGIRYRLASSALVRGEISSSDSDEVAHGPEADSIVCSLAEKTHCSTLAKKSYRLDR